MLLDDDVMADGETKASTFASRLGGEEGIEHLVLHIRRDAGTVVAYPDLDPGTEASGRCRQDRLIPITVGFSLAFGGRIEAIGDQV